MSVTISRLMGNMWYYSHQQQSMFCLSVTYLIKKSLNHFFIIFPSQNCNTGNVIMNSLIVNNYIGRDCDIIQSVVCKALSRNLFQGVVQTPQIRPWLCAYIITVSSIRSPFEYKKLYFHFMILCQFLSLNKSFINQFLLYLEVYFTKNTY